MTKFQDLTIRKKITVILMVTSTSAILLSCCLFILFSQYSHLNDLKKDLTGLCEVIGINSAATLRFNLHDEARDILSALGARPSIVFAVIKEGDGTVFTAYRRDGKTGGITSQNVGTRGFLKVFRPIRQSGDKLGSIHLYDDRSSIYKAVKRDLSVLLFVMVIGLITAYLISSRLQALISGPILKLSETARTVSEQRDYAIRAPLQNRDEIGLLIDSFNGMLEQIEKRDADLNRLRKLLQNIIDSMPSALVAVDAHSKVIQWNYEAEHLTGVSWKEAQGCRFTEVFTGVINQMDDLERWVLGQEKHKTSNVPTYFNGESHYSDVTVYPLRANGMDGSVIRVDDVTDRVQIEEALRVLNEELEERVTKRTQELQTSLENLQKAQKQLVEAEKMASLGGLVAGVAHEINTPIGVSLTDASFLEKKTRDLHKSFQGGNMTRRNFEKYTELALQSAMSIQSNIKRAAELVQSFKLVAVDQSSEIKRWFLVKEYIEEILRSLRNTLKKTTHTVTVDCPGDLGLNSYPGAFSQILTNFIINSLTHGFEGMEKGTITFDVKRAGEMIRFKYSDNGKGMAPHIHEKIFDPFYTTKRGQGGTGLGMHIVYNLVTRSLGGTITCVTFEGRGVTFILDIPLDAPERNNVPNRPLKSQSQSPLPPV